MKHFLISSCLLVISCSLFACTTLSTLLENSTPPVVMEITDATPFSIIIPNDNSIYELQNGVFSGIILRAIQQNEDLGGGILTSNGRSPYTFSGFRFLRSGDNITLLKVRGRNNNTGLGSKDQLGYISYTFKQDASKEGSNFVLTLTPLKKEKGLYNGQYDVQQFTRHEWQDYLSTLDLHYTLEIESEYPNEAIQANFERNFEKANQYWVSIWNGPAEEFSPAYNLIYKDEKMKFAAISSPYRNGSKTVIKYTVPIYLTSENEFNVSEIVEDINSIFRKVVEE